MKKKIFYILAATMIFLGMAGTTAMADPPLSYEEAENRAAELQQEANRVADRADELEKLSSKADEAAVKADGLATMAEQLLQEIDRDATGTIESVEDLVELQERATQLREEATRAMEEANKLNKELEKANKAVDDARKAATQANTVAEEIKLAEEQAAIDANWKPLKPTLIPKPDLLPGPGTDAQKDANSGAKSILVDTILPNLTLGMIGFGGLWALVFLIVGSVRFMTSYGNEESAKKAKEQIVYSIVGFMIALLAYAIVTIIINLRIEGNTSRPTSFIETAYAEKLCSPPCGNDKVCVNSTCIKQIDALMSRPGETSAGQKYKDTKAVANLPSVTIENIFTTVIKSVLGWSMILTIIAIVVAAVFYLTSQGKEENTTKAKGILINLLIGLAIMAAAYGIVTGIAQFNFFTAAPQ